VTVRAPRDEEAPALRSLQSLLAHADPALVDAALEGPFRCRVAVDAGTVVGYAIVLPGAETILSELAVAPAHRRAGHGRALVAAVAGDAERVVVTTPADDEDAIGFYRALGFEVETRLEGFYESGADALRLARRE